MIKTNLENMIKESKMDNIFNIYVTGSFNHSKSPNQTKRLTKLSKIYIASLMLRSIVKKKANLSLNYEINIYN